MVFRSNFNFFLTAPQDLQPLLLLLVLPGAPGSAGAVAQISRRHCPLLLHTMVRSCASIPLSTRPWFFPRRRHSPISVADMREGALRSQLGCGQSLGRCGETSAAGPGLVATALTPALQRFTVWFEMSPVPGHHLAALASLGPTIPL